MRATTRGYSLEEECALWQRIITLKRREERHKALKGRECLDERFKCQCNFLPGAAIDTATSLNLKSAMALQILWRHFMDHFL